MLKLFKLPTALILSTLMLPCAAQDSIHLVCSGSINTTTDGRVKLDLVTKLDVTVNTASSFVEIDGGYWGCMADLGNNENSKCIGKQPVTITDSEIKFEAHSMNDQYDGQTTVKVNRYSGSLLINSVAYSNPAAQAIWRLTRISGRLQCSHQKKSF